MFGPMRWLIAALVVVGLAAGVWLLWTRSADDGPPVTEAAPSTTTTTLPQPTTSTTLGSEPSTTGEDSHVVQTVEEAEEILRELWFGWFEGIYNQDEERIREVVVLEETVETAKESFGSLSFSEAPTQQLIALSRTEVLRSDATCLAVWSELDVSGFRPDAVGSSGVYVIRHTDAGWALLSVWPNRNDVWEAECESLLR